MGNKEFIGENISLEEKIEKLVETDKRPAKIPKERGALLTIWLILMLPLNLWATFIYITSSTLIISAFPEIPLWAIYFFAILAALNVIFVIFLFLWKKWAFWATCITMVIAAIMNLIFLGKTFSGSLGLLSPIILYFIIRSRLDFFE